MSDTVTLSRTRDEAETKRTHRVLLWNDDVTPYQAVVMIVMACCFKTTEEAEQITLIAHTKGKAYCYSGSESDCELVTNNLNAFGLNAEMVTL